jgi:hypothetical protein
MGRELESHLAKLTDGRTGTAGKGMTRADASTSGPQNDPPDDAACLQILKRFSGVAERASLNRDIRHNA